MKNYTFTFTYIGRTGTEYEISFPADSLTEAVSKWEEFALTTGIPVDDSVLNIFKEPDHKYDDIEDEEDDRIVAQQELEDFEQCDEYFGDFGSDDPW